MLFSTTHHACSFPYAALKNVTSIVTQLMSQTQVEQGIPNHTHLMSINRHPQPMSCSEKVLTRLSAASLTEVSFGADPEPPCVRTRHVLIDVWCSILDRSILWCRSFGAGRSTSRWAIHQKVVWCHLALTQGTASCEMHH